MLWCNTPAWAQVSNSRKNIRPFSLCGKRANIIPCFYFGLTIFVFFFPYIFYIWSIFFPNYLIFKKILFFYLFNICVFYLFFWYQIVAFDSHFASTSVPNILTCSNTALMLFTAITLLTIMAKWNLQSWASPLFASQKHLSADPDSSEPPQQ